VSEYLVESSRIKIDEVRIAQKDDADIIVKLVNDAYRPEAGLSGWTYESNLVGGYRTTIKQVIDTIEKPNSVILVGLCNKIIVVCVHIEHENHNSYIGMLAVNPMIQGSNLGKQMLSFAENFGQKNFDAQKFVMIVMSARTELISFYLRRGYKRTGTVMDYPVTADVGIPKLANLKIEILEKISDSTPQII
jgi:ribosomal protein S18 acetylase RimI-like enzyme